MGSAAHAAEIRKHAALTEGQDWGWTCVPITVETYGNYWKRDLLLPCIFAIRQPVCKLTETKIVTAEIYCILLLVGSTKYSDITGP